jgi:hypothetical protein
MACLNSLLHIPNPEVGYLWKFTISKAEMWGSELGFVHTPKILDFLGFMASNRHFCSRLPLKYVKPFGFVTQPQPTWGMAVAVFIQATKSEEAFDGVVGSDVIG